ncbi:transcriptional antiterminator [Enterococcus faecalis]|nr:transcriptional antiterminator [Enterococcus faecalis]
MFRTKLLNRLLSMSELIHIKQLSQTADYAAFVLKFKQFVTAET